MKIIKRILNFGTQSIQDITEIQKQRFFNLFFIIALLTNTFSSIYNLLKGNIFIAFINIFQISIFAFVIYLTYQGKYLFLRLGTLFLLSITVFATALFFDNGMEYRLMILMVPAVILFENIFKFLVYTFLMSLAFTYCRIDDFLHLGMALNIVLIKGIQIFTLVSGKNSY
jgi:hypothetical protein